MAACSTTDEADDQHEMTISKRIREQNNYATAGRFLPDRVRMRSVRATVRVRGRTTDVSALDTVNQSEQPTEVM